MKAEISFNTYLIWLVCMHVCMFVCMPVSTCLCVSACLYVCFSVCLSVFLCASLFVCVSVFVFGCYGDVNAREPQSQSLTLSWPEMNYLFHWLNCPYLHTITYITQPTSLLNYTADLRAKHLPEKKRELKQFEQGFHTGAKNVYEFAVTDNITILWSNTQLRLSPLGVLQIFIHLRKSLSKRSDRFS